MSALVGLIGTALIALAAKSMHFGDTLAAAIGGAFVAIAILAATAGGYL